MKRAIILLKKEEFLSTYTYPNQNMIQHKIWTRSKWSI